MFTTSNRIIMVDDRDNDLINLSAVFSKNGIGCRTFVYDPFYSSPMKGVKMLFMDINLNSTKSDQERNAVLQDAIIKYIHEDNGPYALIFWTSNIEWIESFLDYVNRTPDEDLNKRNPYFVGSIDKYEFYDPAKELEDKVKQIFSSPIVSMLFDFDDIMSFSISDTISKLLSIIPKGAKWGDNSTFETNSQKVFSSIAVQTLGYQNAKEDPDRAIKEAMIPIFADSFLNEPHCIWNTNLYLLKESKNSKEISFPDFFDEAQLNHIFHLDDRSVNKNDRGAVSPLLNMDDWFFHQFGCTYDEWFTNSFPSIEEVDKKKAIAICVEFSAACDFSQRRPRTNKFLLGVILPSSSATKLKVGKNVADCILPLPYKFRINTEEKVIALNMNYSFTVVSLFKDEWIGNPLFCFKKELMDMIGNKYANHISRIGITTFR